MFNLMYYVASPPDVLPQITINSETGLVTFEQIPSGVAAIIVTVRILVLTKYLQINLYYHRLLLQRQMCHLVILSHNRILHQWSTLK